MGECVYGEKRIQDTNQKTLLEQVTVKVEESWFGEGFRIMSSMSICMCVCIFRLPLIRLVGSIDSDAYISQVLSKIFPKHPSRATQKRTIVFQHDNSSVHSSQKTEKFLKV